MADKGVCVTRRNETRIQYGALPFRRRAGHSLEILLITSREARRWIIPKGWPVKSLPPHQAAAREAIEEAGVAGIVTRRSIGTYSYEKRLSDGSSVICQVIVFALEVRKQMSRWKEQEQRRRKWFEAQEATLVLKEPELSTIIDRLPPQKRN